MQTVVEIGVALNKLKNVIVSAVIKSNYLAFRLASHANLTGSLLSSKLVS